MRKWIAAALTGCLLMGLTGCETKQTAVPVQSVSALAEMGSMTANDRFSGIVVSESVTEVQRDPEKSIAQLYVKAGQM